MENTQQPTNSVPQVISTSPTMQAPVQQPNVVYVEKKSKTWLYVLIGIVISLLCCCGIGVALFGTSAIAITKVMGPAIKEFTAQVESLDKEYAQYTNDPKFSSCVETEMRDVETTLKTNLEAKIKAENSKDPTEVMKTVMDEIAIEMKSAYSNCADQVDPQEDMYNDNSDDELPY